MSGDYYQMVADEFKVSRIQVKHLCMGFFYSNFENRGISLLDQMRAVVRTAILVGTVTPRKASDDLH